METSVSEKILKFFSTYKTLEYKKGEVLIRAYENPKQIFLLTEGLVKMYSISKNGNEFVLNIFKPLSFFPLSIALNKNENQYYFETMTKVKIKIAPDKKVIEFLKTNPDVLFDLLQRLYRGIDGLLLKLDYAMTSSARSRLIMELLIEAKRFGKKNGKQYELNISISDLATTVGLARETVSREIKQLKEKNLISINNKKLTIPDSSKLIEEIG